MTGKPSLFLLRTPPLPQGTASLAAPRWGGNVFLEPCTISHRCCLREGFSSMSSYTHDGVVWCALTSWLQVILMQSVTHFLTRIVPNLNPSTRALLTMSKEEGSGATPLCPCMGAIGSSPSLPFPPLPLSLPFSHMLYDLPVCAYVCHCAFASVWVQCFLNRTTYC